MEMEKYKLHKLKFISPEHVIPKHSKPRKVSLRKRPPSLRIDQSQINTARMVGIVQVSRKFIPVTFTPNEHIGVQ